MNGCLGLFIGIVVLVVMLFFKLPLWSTFLLSAVITAFIVGGLDFLIHTIYRVTIDPTTIDLVTIMFLIAVLVSMYKMTGFIDKLGKRISPISQKALYYSYFCSCITWPYLFPEVH